MKRTKQRMVRYLTGLTLFCLAFFPAASAKTPKPARRDIEKVDQLNSLTRDLPEINRVVQVGKKGSYTFSLPMHSNDVVLVTVEKVTK